MLFPHTNQTLCICTFHKYTALHCLIANCSQQYSHPCNQQGLRICQLQCLLCCSRFLLMSGFQFLSAHTTRNRKLCRKHHHPQVCCMMHHNCMQLQNRDLCFHHCHCSHCQSDN